MKNFIFRHEKLLHYTYPSNSVKMLQILNHNVLDQFQDQMASMKQNSQNEFSVPTKSGNLFPMKSSGLCVKVL